MGIPANRVLLLSSALLSEVFIIGACTKKMPDGGENGPQVGTLVRNAASAARSASDETAATKSITDPTSNTDALTKSYDFSASWTSIRYGGGGYIKGFWPGKNNKTIFATTDSLGLYLSEDRGKNWTPMSLGLRNSGATSIRAVAYIGGTYYLVSGNETDYMGGVYQWDSSAGSWKVIAGFKTGFDDDLEYNSTDLRFDGGWFETEARTGYCSGGGAFRPVATGQVIIEGSVACSGSTDKPIYFGSSYSGVYRKCGTTWSKVYSTSDRVEAIQEVAGRYLLIGTMAPSNSTAAPLCPLAVLDQSDSNLTTTCLSVSGLSEVRDIALKGKSEAYVAGGPSGLWVLELSTKSGFSIKSSKQLIDPGTRTDCSSSSYGGVVGFLTGRAYTRPFR